MTTWAQLTPDEQAYLSDVATSDKAVDGWIWIGDITELTEGTRDSLAKYGLIEYRVSSLYCIRHVKATPAGLLVWQQGQAASTPPRSVWVAMWHEYGEGDYLLSIHAQHETAQTACEVHAEQALKWEYAAGFDGMGEYRARVYDDDVLQGEYFVHEMPVLP